MNVLGDFIRVALTREGRTVVHFAVEYEAMIEGQYRPVARYDTAHGFAHRDLLGWDGETVRWDRMRDVPYNEALTEAVNDLRDNWERYRTDYLRRRP